MTYQEALDLLDLEKSKNTQLRLELAAFKKSTSELLSENERLEEQLIKCRDHLRQRLAESANEEDRLFYQKVFGVTRFPSSSQIPLVLR